LLSERHRDLTPYNYVMNNPLNYIDIMGLDTSGVNPPPQNGGTLPEVTVTATRIYKPNNSNGFYQYARNYDDTWGLSQRPISEQDQAAARSRIEVADKMTRLFADGIGLLAGPEMLGADAAKLAVPIFIAGLKLEVIGLVRVTTEDGVMIFSTKIGPHAIEGIANYTVTGEKLLLDALHIQGGAAGEVGRPALREMFQKIGKQFNVEEVIIQGGKRTTGKYTGQVPSGASIK
jgi:hypothetical protein